jgi:hypothetical protein
MTTEGELDAPKLQKLQNSILEFKCSAMRSAMTQEGGTCFINAAFNLIRLSPDFSKLIQLKTQNIVIDEETTDYLPAKCKREGKLACENRMVHMADVRNKRRYLGETICKKESGDVMEVLRDICDTYGISLGFHPTIVTEVKISTNKVVDDKLYKLVGSVIHSGSHYVCGYFCKDTDTDTETTARVFDSNGSDIAYDWASAGRNFDVTKIVTDVFNGLSRTYAISPSSGPRGHNIYLVYILVSSLVAR